MQKADALIPYTQSNTYCCMISSALAFIVYKRPHTTKKVFEAIRQAQPPRLYLIADGPQSPEL